MIKKSLATLFLISVGIATGFAEQQQSKPTTPPSTILIKIKNGNDSVNRPKSPDRQRVTVIYDGEQINLNFVIPEGSATLTVSDASHKGGVYSIDTSELDASVEIGTLTGTVTVELDTEKGNSYCGKFEY